VAEPATRYDFDRVVRLLFTAGLVVGLFWLLRELSDILVPFAIAAVLAYLLNPIVTLIERRIGRRWPAVLITVVGLLALLVTLGVVLVPMLVAELSQFDSMINTIKTSGTAFAERLRHSVQNPMDSRMAWLVEQVRQFLVSEDFKSLLASAVQRAVPTAWSLVAGALNTLLAMTVIILVLVYLLFLLFDYRLFARTWKQYLPPPYRDAIVDFVTEFQKAMRRYFRGQFVVACITGIVYAIGFRIIGLPLGIALGLLIGILNMVPYLQSIAFIPACMLGVVRAIDHQSSIVVSLLLVIAVFALMALMPALMMLSGGGMKMLKAYAAMGPLLNPLTRAFPYMVVTLAALLAVVAWQQRTNAQLRGA